MAKITQETLPDVLKVQGVNAAGFGFIPKAVMQDQRISRDAKAIYAYFCSFAGAGETAFPGIKKICTDLGFKDDETFRKHRKQLENCGYIIVDQIRGEKGKFNRNIYTIVSNPVETTPISQSLPTPKKPATDKTRTPINSGTKSNRSLRSLRSLNTSFKSNSVSPIHNFEERTYSEQDYEKHFSN